MTTASEYLLEKINNMPNHPGIYKMLDSEHRVIYIGKSISLKNRVRSYFADKPKWEKAERMVPFIADIEYMVTDTHLEAVLLECELIKSIKPLFNSQLKNDERYIYLKIEDYNIHNPLSVVYVRENHCYGPFRRKFSMMELLNSLKNIYPIIKTSKGYDFNYHLMPLPMNQVIFEENKNALQMIFSDDKELILLIHQLEEKMKEAATKLQFATASYYRDLIYGLNYLKTGIYGYKTMMLKDMVLTLPIDSGYKLFFISKGEILLKSIYPSLTEDIVADFINESKNLPPHPSGTLNEKSSMDYRDILYSQIKSLPVEMVFYL